MTVGNHSTIMLMATTEVTIGGIKIPIGPTMDVILSDDPDPDTITVNQRMEHTAAVRIISNVVCVDYCTSNLFFVFQDYDLQLKKKDLIFFCKKLFLFLSFCWFLAY
jgi:hypothetical protein